MNKCHHCLTRGDQLSKNWKTKHKIIYILYVSVYYSPHLLTRNDQWSKMKNKTQNNVYFVLKSVLQ